MRWSSLAESFTAQEYRKPSKKSSSLWGKCSGTLESSKWMLSPRECGQRFSAKNKFMNIEFHGSQPLLCSEDNEGHSTIGKGAVSYTHLRAHETRHDLVCRLLLE